MYGPCPTPLVNYENMKMLFCSYYRNYEQLRMHIKVK